VILSSYNSNFTSAKTPGLISERVRRCFARIGILPASHIGIPEDFNISPLPIFAVIIRRPFDHDNRCLDLIDGEFSLNPA
jgi:hypothetical protein